ncbi:retrovirus-related pol polyprotein from transposon TNT 1-94 [Tanacetum coccineum]
MFSKTNPRKKKLRILIQKLLWKRKLKNWTTLFVKMGQSAQTVHMLTKPQDFYDNNLKQNLGFQNPFYLKKAQQIRPMLYDGNVIAKETMISIADSEETLMLEEESRSKMLLKQKLFDEQALHPIIDQYASSPVKIDALWELPKTTPNALTEEEWGFEHTKVVFQNEIIPFLKTLKDIFIVFDKDLLNEVTEVQTIFNKMEAAVQQEAHEYYLKHTMEQAAILREVVEQAKSRNPLDSASYSACMYVKLIQDLLGYVRDTFPNIHKASEKLVAVTPINKKKIVRFANTTASSSNMPKVVQIILWYLDSSCSKHMTGDRSQLTNFIHKFLGTVKFDKDQVTKIMGYGDYQIGKVTFSRVYYVEGLGHNLFSIGSRGTNLYSLSIGDMMASSPICLLSKDTKTKSWLWHQCLSHLNFGALNHLARNGLVRGLPRLKFEKDHLCSTCAMGKSKKQSHKPKSEDTNQEKLYLLHMDLCGPMRVASVNGKRYILVIVDDYSWFTWVKFLASKDEALDFIIKFLKMIQVRLNAPVRNIRTDNGTEFVNQTLRDYYE